MGTVFSSFFSARKRPRESDESNGGSANVDGVPEVSSSAGASNTTIATTAAALSPSPFARHLRQLRYRHVSSSSSLNKTVTHVGAVVCRHVDEDAATQQTYGCHAHLYETATAGESHGVALAWCVTAAAPLSTLSLLSLCRVANSCRKKTLLTSPQGDALILTYTATL